MNWPTIQAIRAYSASQIVKDVFGDCSDPGTEFERTRVLARCGSAGAPALKSVLASAAT